jgi:tetraacyldisaccharide 4'-kinase
MAVFGEQYIRRAMSGEQRGMSAAVFRGITAIVEPLYASAMKSRNRLYKTGLLRSHRLPVPVISIGNMTAGGTGKTPCVQWLFEQLSRLWMRPAILMRGYRHAGSSISDEQVLLKDHLPGSIVHANSDRVTAAQDVLRDNPEINIFILDDGFQHHRLVRDFDLVLIDATNPFGYGRVHPRGLLREPLTGFKRADALILTRSDLVTPERLREIESQLIAHNHIAPIYHAHHQLSGLHEAGLTFPLEKLSGHRFFAVAGIARPEALFQQLSALPGEFVGHRWMPDHHHYTDLDLSDIQRQASQVDADLIIVTEKDWVKIRDLPSIQGTSQSVRIPIQRLQVKFELSPQAADGLVSLILARIDKNRKPTS